MWAEGMHRCTESTPSFRRGQGEEQMGLSVSLPPSGHIRIVVWVRSGPVYGALLIFLFCKPELETLALWKCWFTFGRNATRQKDVVISGFLHLLCLPSWNIFAARGGRWWEVERGLVAAGQLTAQS